MYKGIKRRRNYIGNNTRGTPPAQTDSVYCVNSPDPEHQCGL